ncbi:MAG: CD225/dispanin family protein [Acidobacteriota bacterium]|nr:CD225/dispanin family protein [Acidobacteriota bacterium]
MISCPHCGTSNLDNSAICANCGRALAVPPAPEMQSSYTPPPPPPAGSYAPPPSSYPPPGMMPTGERIPNYLVQSILVTLCCCLPLGIVAIIFAAQVNSKIAMGDIAGARDASKKAKMFCLIAVLLGIVSSALIFLVNGAAFFSALQHSR